jgi:signal transduction histidine kinase
MVRHMGAGEGVFRRLRAIDPVVSDVCLAVALAAVTLIELWTFRDCACVSGPEFAWSAVFMLALTLPLALRRRFPLGVALVVGVSATVYDALDIPPDPKTAVFPLLVAVYSVAAYATRRRAWIAGAITAAAVVVLNLPSIAGARDFGDVVQPFVMLGGAWVLGENTRSRLRQRELLRERAERAEREREEQARIGALEERARIAREIHDVVAHSVSVIGIQAGAARRLVEDDPDRAKASLTAIEEVSREAMGELRRALGVLRTPSDAAALTPQPGLGVLDDLVEHFRTSGLDVVVTTRGDPRRLPFGLDLAAYRVVQEALTNTLKHSTAQAAQVHIDYRPDGLELTIEEDTGARRSSIERAQADEGPSGGHGLVGMRERVAMFGGMLEAGEGSDGYVVRALFPIGSGERG